MDFKGEQSGTTDILASVLEAVFNTEGHYYTNMRPLHVGPTLKPVQERSTVNPFQKRRAEKPNYEEPVYIRFYRRFLQSYETTTIKPLHEKPTLTLVHKRTTTTPPTTYSPSYERTIEPATITVVHSSGLEKCLWVALGGIGVLILMAIFMKLGKPIRRVRRRLSNSRTAPGVSVTLNPNDGNLDMGSHVRLVDGAVYNDPPPPYECVSINKYDSEEPPPRYSASFESLSIHKDAEPQVHTRRQNDHVVENDLVENGVRVESVAKTLTSNDRSNIALGMQNELVFDNGRIVERLILDMSRYNNETAVV